MRSPLRYNLAIRMREKSVINSLNIDSSDYVLDIGCGLGYMTELIRGKAENVFGIDISYGTIKFCDRNGRATYIVASCTHLPFKQNTFSKILMTEVLEHISDESKVLREIGRVSKPGVTIVISVPAKEGLRSRSCLRMLCHEHGNEQHVRTGYFKDELLKVLLTNNLKVRTAQYNMFFFSELFVEFSKVMYKIRYKKFEDQSELMQSQDSVLFTILRLIFPIIFLLSIIEDRIMIPVFKRGHNLVAVCSPAKERKST